MSGTVAIIDLGTGNLRSVWRALNRAGAAASVTSESSQLRLADKIVLPGVGNFARAMSGMHSSGLRDALDEAVLERKMPILGICLGMELMAHTSEEGRVRGLAWIKGSVRRFRPRDKERYKVPFIGWSHVAPVKENRLFAGHETSDEYYFLHSYYVDLEDETCRVAEATYESRFTAAIESDNIFGVQFHPERSHVAGVQVLRNFLAI